MPWNASGGKDRPRFDDPEKDKAARFLYADVDAESRIRGIETVELARKWLKVETQREDPDPDVIGLLNRRIRSLRDTSARTEGSA